VNDEPHPDRWSTTPPGLDPHDPDLVVPDPVAWLREGRVVPLDLDHDEAFEAWFDAAQAGGRGDRVDATASVRESDASARRVFQRALGAAATPTTNGRSTRRTRWAVAGGIAAVIAATGGVVVNSLTPRGTPSNSGAVSCWSAAADDANQVVVDAGDDPLETCRDLWRQGVLPGDAVVNRPSEPPALIACVDDAGNLKIVPGAEGVCDQLGMVQTDL
jgi:hypothetical protein